MELAASLIPLISSPAFSSTQLEEFRSAQIGRSWDTPGTSKPEEKQLLVADQGCRPKQHGSTPGRIKLGLGAGDYRLFLDELTREIKHPQWRVDGYGGGGTQFFVIPQFMGPEITPLRMDLVIPDQELYPPNLRAKLHCSAWYPHSDDTNDGHELPVIQYLLIALESWSNKQLDLRARLASLPFGSQIIVSELLSDPRMIEMYILPGHQIERRLHPTGTLESLYKLAPHDNWPPTIDIERLYLQRQIQDNITLVSLRGDSISGLMVFKSSLNDFDYLYHELHHLLSLTPHSNIIGSPTHLVTKKCRFGGKAGVVGFLLPYYARGDLGKLLPRMIAQDRLLLNDQVKWAKQITSALSHIQASGTYYSDLRPDNLLVTDSNDIILIDFEQRGNWYSWLPPEVRYLQYLQTLNANIDRFGSFPKSRHKAMSKLPPDMDKMGLETMLQRSGRTMGLLCRAGFPATVDQSNAWRALTPQEQESAMVFNLGKLLWCLFEGSGSLPGDFWGVQLDVDGLRYPQFSRTPEDMRKLISDCTVGESEHWMRGPGLSIVGSRLVSSDENLTADEQTSFRLLHQWWKKELENMRRHFESGAVFSTRPTLKEVAHRLDLLRDTSKT